MASRLSIRFLFCCRITIGRELFSNFSDLKVQSVALQFSNSPLNVVQSEDTKGSGGCLLTDGIFADSVGGGKAGNDVTNEG